jgi:alkanesulfonate monooxygenase SsuD/methylene tetrahydromethanopterin reductase-like flavin-dependent oxidoreductase (luciferase family)
MADGWFPGRCPFVMFDRLLERLRAGAAEAGRSMALGIVPLLSPGRDRADGLARVNVEALLDEARAKPGWDAPFGTADDLRGALIAGNPDDIVAELAQFQARGVDEVVLDLRQRMDAFEGALDMLARDVLPAFAAGGRPAASPAA